MGGGNVQTLASCDCQKPVIWSTTAAYSTGSSTVLISTGPHTVPFSSFTASHEGLVA